MFAAGFSMPLARAFFVASLACLAAQKICRRRQGTTADASPPARFDFASPFAGFLAYFALAVIVSGAAALADSDPLLVPVKGFSKLNKLAWYAFIPLAVRHLRDARTAERALKALVLGCLATAVSVALLHPAIAWFQVTMPHPKLAADTLTFAQKILREIAEATGATHEIFIWIRKGGVHERYLTFTNALSRLGTMPDAQRLMVALPAAAALALAPRRRSAAALAPAEPRRAAAAIVAAIKPLIIPAVIFVGLALTLKRGPLALGFASTALLLLFARRRGGMKSLAPSAAMIAAAAALVLSFPAARERFAQLPEEFSVEKGGRAAMWLQVAPQLRREHPFGIGFRSLTSEKMRAIAPHIEESRVHLHSVPVQSWVDFGWPGLAFWALWMSLAFRAAWKRAASVCGGAARGEACVPGNLALAAAPLAMLFTLVGYSFWEYNIADGEVVLLYIITMAFASAPLSSSEFAERDRSDSVCASAAKPRDVI